MNERTPSKRMLSRRSIKQKLIFIMSVLMVSLVLILTTIQISSQMKLLEVELSKRITLMMENLRERGKSSIQTLAQQIEINLASFNFSRIMEDIRSSVDNNPEIAYAILMDASGKVYSHTKHPHLLHSVLSGDRTERALKQTETAVFDDTEEGTHIIEIIRPIQVSTQPWGVLRLVYTLNMLEQEIRESKTQIKREIQGMIYKTTITSVVFIVFCLIAVYLISARFSAPLIYLARCARKISKGDFGAASSIQILSGDEVGALSASFVEMSRALDDSYRRLEEYSKNLEQKVADRTEELRQKNIKLVQVNHKLEGTLNELKQSQTQLVQSEKMAALGHLIAGIAHEINTPLGVIRGASDNIFNGLKETILKFPEFFSLLEGRELDAFFHLLKRAMVWDERISSREARKMRRTVEKKLKSGGIENARTLADYLVDMGLMDEVDQLYPLLKNEQAQVFVHSAYRFSSLVKNNRNIITAVERASKIVFALKKFAHHDHAGERVFADIVDGLDTVLTLYHNQIKHGVEVVKKYEEIPPILCYPDDLNQVWTNLIHNALQAMDYKGRLIIHIERKEDAITVSITDSGCGIPIDIQERIYEPFFTTKPAGEGSGLGLDISRKIIEKHEGALEFESEPGKTTFRVILPIYPDEKKESEPGQPWPDPGYPHR